MTKFHELPEQPTYKEINSGIITKLLKVFIGKS